MARQLHSAPAAAGMTFILTVAGLAFIAVSMLASGSPSTYRLLQIASAGKHVRNLVPAVITVLLAGYFAGIVGWLVLLVVHNDGKRRLESLLNGSR